jgi:branched-chain amino acid transport system permease protein
VPDPDTLIPLIAINALLAWSMWVPLAVGRIWFGTAGIAGLGAYTVGWLASDRGVESPWILLAAATLVGVVAMGLCSLLAIRLSGFSFALASLGISEIIRIILNNIPSLGGAAGLTNVPVFDFVGSVGTIAIVVVLVCSRLVFRRPLGRECDAIAVDELFARSVSIRAARVRLLPFAAAGAAAGFAGGLICCNTGYLEPTMFGLDLNVEVFAYVVIGGVASYFGPIVGAIVLTTFIEAGTFFGDYRDIVFGAVIVIMVMVRREGIVPRLRVFQEIRLKRLLRARHRESESGGSSKAPTRELVPEGP